MKNLDRALLYLIAANVVMFLPKDHNIIILDLAGFVVGLFLLLIGTGWLLRKDNNGETQKANRE